MKDTVLFLGTFVMPDEKASAIRVYGIAKVFKELGYEVVLQGKNIGFDGYKLLEGSISYCSRPKWNTFSYYFDCDYAISKIVEIGSVSTVYLYHVPPVVAIKLLRYCKRNHIIIISDTTEWYTIGSLIHGKSALFNVLSFLGRIYISNKLINNNIVISSFLARYYHRYNTLIIPILAIDNGNTISRNWNDIRICYCGSPKRKDLLLPVIQAAQKAQDYGLPIVVSIVGCSQDQFQIENKYTIAEKYLNGIRFYGRIEHDQALNILKTNDFSVIIRPNKRYANAGFPTKLVEALSCGVGVIATKTSDIPKYVVNGKNGFLLDSVEPKEIFELFKKLCSINGEDIETIRNNAFNTSLKFFSPTNYINQLTNYMERCKEKVWPK